jgi:hypothetical protein
MPAQLMVEREVLPGRSWQSIKERFQKVPHLSKPRPILCSFRSNSWLPMSSSYSVTSPEHHEASGYVRRDGGAEAEAAAGRGAGPGEGRPEEQLGLGV